MKRIVIFGNSGSGKTTLAKRLSQAGQLAHLDLDTLAWLPGTPPSRKPLNDSKHEIEKFVGANESWVIEGCYSDLLELVIPWTTELIYLDVPVEQCVNNARLRPWEPHKYETKQAQDENLEMLIEWIRQYDCREDTFSKSVHESLYVGYPGRKTIYTSNDYNQEPN